jgi:hypothetical protein
MTIGGQPDAVNSVVELTSLDPANPIVPTHLQTLKTKDDNLQKT